MFKDGDKVWHFKYGWGILKTYETIMLKFQSNENRHLTELVNNFGKTNIFDKNPCIFHNEVKNWPNPDPPLPKLEIDTKVWVRDTKKEKWHTGHFCGWDESGKIKCWSQGCTSHTSNLDTLWNYYSLTNPNET